MRVGKKVIAGILAAVMVVSSMQVSTGTVYAEELLEESVEVDGGVEELEEEAEADGVTEKLEEEETDGATGELEEVEAGSGTEGLEKAEGEISGAYQFGGRPSGEVVSSDSSGVFVDGAIEEGSLEEYLYQQIIARNTEINISSYNIAVSDLGNIISGILNEHPELYFVNREFSYSYSGTIVSSVLFTYNNEYDDSAFQTAKTEALSVVEQGMSDLEKAIVLHDYLAVNCEYDKVNYNAGTIPEASYSAYGVLVNRIAVCNGYALAYKYLLNAVGIECYMVTSSSMNHAWNLVVLDGQYYQVDVTWDDPTWDLIGRVCHNNMLCSDFEFDNHSDWYITKGAEVVDYAATDTRYDSAFWTDCCSPLVFVGNDCYYISSDDRAVMKGALDNVTETGTGICDIGIWQAWGNSYSYWPGAYSGLFQVNNRLYYNDMNSIYSIALDGTDKCTEFTADTTDGYIYGSALCQGKVLYSLHQTPNLDAVETVLTADIVFESEEPVIVPVESVALSADSLTLTEQESATLTVTISPKYATETDVTWTSSDESVATVEGGIVTAVASGNCTITATVGEKTASCNVIVEAAIITKETVEISGITIQYRTVHTTVKQFPIMAPRL